MYRRRYARATTLRKRAPRRYRKTRRTTYRRPGALRAVVKSVMRRSAETKFITDPFIAYNPQATAPSSAFAVNVIPNIAQGDDSHQRVGEKITAMYLKVNGIIRYNLANLYPIYVQIYILESKRNRDGNNRTTSDVTFLRQNNSLTTLSGTHANSLLPVDTDYFRVIKKMRIKLAPGSREAALGSGQDQVAPAFRYFNCKIPVKGRTLTYPVSNALACQPENCNMFLIANVVNIANSTPEGFQAEMTYVSHFYYKDI